MALSLSFFLVCTTLLLARFAQITEAAVVTYDFNITWVTAAPDGFDRPTIGINGQWPLPVMHVTKGDRVIVNVLNKLGNQTTTIHFHGIFQNGSTEMDGPFGVSQCGIEPNSSFTYNFTIDQPGTYWYHSHSKGQYPDGLRAPLIVEDPDSPFKGQYDEEVILSVSDWYHDQMQDLIPAFMSKANPTGAEPVPDAALFNDTQNLTIPVQPGKTYLFHMVNIGAFAGQYIWFENHTISIVEVDGVYSQPAEAETIYLAAAQRCSFLLTTKNDTSQNFPFVTSMDTSLFDVLPDTLNWNATGWLVYNENNTNPDPQIIEDDSFNEFDDFTLVPYDLEPLWENPNRSIEMVLKMDNLGDGANYDDDAGDFNASDPTMTKFPATPIRRDTVVINPNGNFVIRFKSSNPGVWLFHCHIEWHMDSGLIATMVEAPLKLQQSGLTIPQGHYDVCKASNTPISGNAAGNTVDLLDLTGQNAAPAPLPDGFTTRGKVALAFSILSALIGLGVIAWYGLADMGEFEKENERRRLASEAEETQTHTSI